MKMRKSIILAGLLMILISFLAVSLAQAGWVRGYYRSDGTYVRPYYRTNPDGNPYNNYSFPGNYNPNTGRITPGNPNTYLERYYNRPYQRSYGAPGTYRPNNYHQRLMEIYDNE
jgi:hypothetical protein